MTHHQVLKCNVDPKCCGRRKDGLQRLEARAWPSLMASAGSGSALRVGGCAISSSSFSNAWCSVGL